MSIVKSLIDGGDRYWGQFLEGTGKLLREKTALVVGVAAIVLGLTVVAGPAIFHEIGINLPNSRVSLPTPNSPIGWPFPANEVTPVSK